MIRGREGNIAPASSSGLFAISVENSHACNTAMHPRGECVFMAADNECLDYARECVRLAELKDDPELVQMAREWMAAAMDEKRRQSGNRGARDIKASHALRPARDHWGHRKDSPSGTRRHRRSLKPTQDSVTARPALWLPANPTGCYRPCRYRVHRKISVETPAQSLARSQQPHIGAPYRYVGVPVRAAQQDDLRFRRD
jgi:hypothetical protein